MSVSDRVRDRLSNRAWRLGVEYGKANTLADVEAKEADNTSKEMYRDATLLRCPMMYFDIFKYGAQSIWRKRGEMKEKLSKGD